MRRIIFAFLILINTLPAYSQQEIRIERISGRTIVAKLIGKYGALNVTAVSTEKGLVVIDSAWPPAETERIRKAIEDETGRNDFVYLINTHGHVDHATGNQVFRDAVIIGHENIFKEMTATESKRERYGLGDDYIMTPPDILFNDKMTLDCGDITFEMFYPGVSHTDAHIWIYVPEEELLIVGDTFDYNYLPWINPGGKPDVAMWIAVLGEILNNENEIKTVVGGHRETFTGGLLRAYHKYLIELWNGVGECIAEGFSLKQTKEKLNRSISRKAFGHLKSKEEDYLNNIESVWNLRRKNN